MKSPQIIALQHQIAKLTDFRISVEWKKRIKKWGPKTPQDGEYLRSIGAKRYFTNQEYDDVLEKCSQYGLWLETIGLTEENAA